jgi:uncharacterized membrane protein
MAWEFEKPADLIFRSQATLEKQADVHGPLDILKMRYVKGEITETEYKKMKNLLEN